MFLSTGCSLLRAEGFSCSLGVLYGGLGISKFQFLIKRIEIKFPAINFFNFWSSNPGSGSGIRNPDPESGSAIIKNTGSGSALNQCGSETLVKINEENYPETCDGSIDTAPYKFWLGSVFTRQSAMCGVASYYRHLSQETFLKKKVVLNNRGWFSSNV